MSSRPETDLARRRLEELISFFGSNADIEVHEETGRVELDITSDATGKLIGHRGETLRSLEYLLSMMMKEAAPGIRFNIDVAGYRKARAAQLTEYAQNMAAKVAETGEEITLRPMNAAERRIVHMALADHPDVETESQGEDPHRRTIIKKR